jgi:hypothetical protein
MIGWLQDGLLRRFSPRRVPAELYTLVLPPGVEVRVNRWLLELHWRLLGVRAPAGCASRTILIHPCLLEGPPGSLDGVLRHELVHVRQFERWGVIGTYRRYVGEWRRHGYADNALEREARGGPAPWDDGT